MSSGSSWTALAVAAAVLWAGAPVAAYPSSAAAADQLVAVPEAAGATPPALPTGSRAANRESRPSPRRATGALSPNTPVTFYWGLVRPESWAEARVASIATPGSTEYRRFLSARQTARTYGASPRTVRTVARYVRSLGLIPTLDKSRVFLRVSGTAQDLSRAFGVKLSGYKSGGFLIVQPSKNPRLGRRVRSLITEPIWVSQQQLSVGDTSGRVAKSAGRSARSGSPSAVRRHPTARDSSPPTNTGTMVEGCPRVARKSTQYFSSGQEAVAYGIDQIRGARLPQGGVGGRPHLGIVSSGSGFSDRVLGRALSCFGAKGVASRVETDHMRGPLVHEPDGEADLDVQSSLEVLRQGGRVVVYEASGSYLSYFLPVAAALNSNRPPTVLSTSNGNCEAEVPQAVRTLTDALYKRLALIGTSSLSAAGDSGSSDCWTGPSDPTEGAVDYPGSSPWVTSVGGTRLTFNADNTRASEVVWNDSPWWAPPTAGGAAPPTSIPNRHGRRA